jgi:pimeloyl-ACP methyl ester carboxylesterase
MKSLLAMAVALSIPAVTAEEARQFHLPLPRELTRADLYVLPVQDPQAVLVLSPGMNGNGKSLITPAWTDFARRHQLALAALSFASSDEDLQNGRGYYYPARGAGQSLLDGLRKIYGHDLPILLYGMSGGAHFTARFVEWKPERVTSWCAYTAGWWDKPKVAMSNPPGIIACGDEDVRYGASLGYFLQGRALGKPWTWVSLAKTGHQSSELLDKFVRRYFAAVLEYRKKSEEWRDVDLKSLVGRQDLKSHPTLACWLPNESVATDWLKIHQP